MISIHRTLMLTATFAAHGSIGYAVTIDLDAFTASALAPVEIVLPKGNHTVTPVSGTYTAWHPWGGDSQTLDCDSAGENCYQGWLANYSIAVPADGGFRVTDFYTNVFETEEQALEASSGALIVSDGETPISFYVPDSFYEDNAGGMTLQIDAAPTGETELEAVLPTSTVDSRFVFEFQPELALLPLVWFDPEIAIGYDYLLSGGLFASVTAPSLGTIPDADGYVVSYGSEVATLLPGETLTLPDGINYLSVGDIDPLLELDPGDDMAFPIGFSFAGVGAGALRLEQIPFVINTDVAPVPLPASVYMVVFGAFSLVAVGRRRRRLV